jgi:hypothetical protein
MTRKKPDSIFGKARRAGRRREEKRDRISGYVNDVRVCPRGVRELQMMTDASRVKTGVRKAFAC